MPICFRKTFYAGEIFPHFNTICSFGEQVFASFPQTFGEWMLNHVWDDRQRGNIRKHKKTEEKRRCLRRPF
jgi:hypothetical protein